MRDPSMNGKQEVAKNLVVITSIEELTDVVIFDKQIVNELSNKAKNFIKKGGYIEAYSIAKILYEIPRVSEALYGYRVTKPENINVTKERPGVWRAKIVYDVTPDDVNDKSKKPPIIDYFGNPISVGMNVVYIDRRKDGYSPSARLAEGEVTGIDRSHRLLYVKGVVTGLKSENVIIRN